MRTISGVLALNEIAHFKDHPDEFYPLLAEVESRHFWFQARVGLVRDALLGAIGPLADRSVLDIGCGTGQILAELESVGMLGCGIDMHLSGLRVARERVRGLVIWSAVPPVPFEGEFDSVLLCDVIEHVADDRELLSEGYKALKPGGVIIVTVPAHPSLWTPIDDLSRHKRRYTHRGLARVMQDAGFDVSAGVRAFNILLAPLQLLQRARWRGKVVAGHVARERLVRRNLWVPPHPWNAVLRRILYFERPLGRLFPELGASLVAVGYKRRS
jgi:SAM-dependent methyltransferase